CGGKLQPAVPSDEASQHKKRDSRGAHFQGYNSPVPLNPIQHGLQVAKPSTTYNAPFAAQTYGAPDNGLGNTISAILNELTGGAVGTITGGSFPSIPSGSNVNFFTAIDPIETQITPKPHNPILKRPQKQIHAFIAIAPEPITNSHQALSTGGHKAPFKQVEPPNSLYGTPLANVPTTSFGFPLPIPSGVSGEGFISPEFSGRPEVNGQTLASPVHSIQSVHVGFETNSFAGGDQITSGFSSAASLTGSDTPPIPANVGFVPASTATVGSSFDDAATIGFAPAVSGTTGFAPAVSATAGFAPAVSVTAGFAPAVSATAGFAPGFSSSGVFPPANSAAPGSTAAFSTTAGFAPAVQSTAELHSPVPATTGFAAPASIAVGVPPPASDTTVFASPVSTTAGIFQNAAPTAQFAPAGAGISIKDERGEFPSIGTVTPSTMISFGIAVPSAFPIPQTVFESNQAPPFTVPQSNQAPTFTVPESNQAPAITIPQSLGTSNFIGSSVTPTPDLTFRGEVGVGNALEAPVINAGHSVTSDFSTQEQFPTSVGGAGFGSSGFGVPLQAASGVTPAPGISGFGVPLQAATGVTSAPGPFESTQFFNFGGLRNDFNEPNQPSSIGSSLNSGNILGAGQGTLLGNRPDNEFGGHGSVLDDVVRAGTGTLGGGSAGGGLGGSSFDSGHESIGATNNNQNPLTNFGNQGTGVSLFDTGSQGNFAGPTVPTQNVDSGRVSTEKGPLIGSEGFNNLIKRDIPGRVKPKESQ
ncbi:trophinin-like, partial [Palaemon carinicauda]|uniref:trophinin-like n=1 Tax=Palaemon carinicauda TaxID=392227 RepID=UPI0035B696E9